MQASQTECAGLRSEAAAIENDLEVLITENQTSHVQTAQLSNQMEELKVKLADQNKATSSNQQLLGDQAAELHSAWQKQQASFSLEQPNAACLGQR